MSLQKRVSEWIVAVYCLFNALSNALSIPYTSHLLHIALCGWCCLDYPHLAGEQTEIQKGSSFQQRVSNGIKGKLIFWKGNSPLSHLGMSKQALTYKL